MKKIAIFPGSFDPFTKGHEDIVLRSLALFDEVIVAIGINSSKVRYLPVEIMVERIEYTFRDYPQVRVATFSGLTAIFAKQNDASFLVRGLRNTTDFEYENTIAQANRYVFDQLETVFLITSPALAAISSTIVRDLHRHGQNVDAFLPYHLE
ncbi:Phosphopantetheine adenylyltransferase [Flexibacter flexilis DSM 6793]|uniref:Phosphopantetheine adenylyltransferase n=1 Tax=Flexibacter flexilis DSM 6793 TaxID=927664 RepID=A0A1I1J1V1_9BACT|nr:pantetheine-phosphate adenylyltransferase [Flexibacter flexilis]SFC40598.1 Phosphopantetheine adenylyltransferase [Flexibacter flexilis DSM 6793]